MSKTSTRTARVFKLIRDGYTDAQITQMTGYPADLIQQMRRDNYRWHKHQSTRTMPLYDEGPDF